MKSAHTSGTIERRTMLRGLASGIAGTVAASGVASASGATSHHLAGSEQAPPPATAAAMPRLLDDHQRRALTSLAETLVPGATAAGTIDLIDRVAAVETLPRQRLLLNAIGAFEHVARTEHRSPWVGLDEPTRLAILRAASTGPESRPDSPAWTKGQSTAPVPMGPRPPSTLRDHFDYLRSLVANTYYTTEPGMRELGWTGRTAWTELPGCDHPEAEHE